MLEDWPPTRPSPWPGEPRKHPFHADPRDLSKIWFWNADDEHWYPLSRRNACDPDMPFNDAALARARRIVLERNRYPRDPEELNAALEELLDRRMRGRERSGTELRMISKAIREADQAELDLGSIRRRLRARTNATSRSPADDEPEPAVDDPIPVPEAGTRMPPIVDAAGDYDLDVPTEDAWAEPLETLE